MFIPTGSLIGSDAATATLLPNGKVLVIGIAGDAELYNPTTGTFTATGSLLVPVDGDAITALNAVLLANGKVLVVGGISGFNPNEVMAIPAPAELYDPATGTFTLTGTPNIGRFEFTATLLKNGMVLVAGGHDEFFDILNSTELYNPATGTFTYTGDMYYSEESSATLLNNGMVLIVGGLDSDLVVPCSNAANLYNPATGTFTGTGIMNVRRCNPTMTPLNNGMVLIAGGGADEEDQELELAAELYDPTAGTFTRIGSLNSDAYTATLLNDGTVLLTEGALVNAQIYNPTTGTFTLTGSMLAPGGFGTLLPNSGTVLMIGAPTAELYEPFVLTPTSLSFANQPTGTTSTSQSFTLMNNPIGQPTESGVTSITINQQAANFAETDNCNAEMPAGTSCSITVTFTPTATGTLTGTLTINDSLTPDSPILASLTGTGIVGGAPITSVSPSTVSFGSVVVGGNSSVVNVVVTNTGTANLVIGTIPSLGSPFFIISNGCGLKTIAPQMSCTIEIQFSPTIAGPASVTMSIPDNAPGSPQTVALTGTGALTAPTISLSSTNLMFVSQIVGTTSGAQPVMLSNSGNAPLIISNLAIGGTNASDFNETNNCGGNVAAGTSCTINVMFAPTASGTRTGSLVLTDNATSPVSPQTITLTGTGTLTAPTISLSSTSISFPSQYVGTSGLPQNVNLTNNGNAPLVITSVVSSAADFGLINACGSTVAVGTTCSVGVFFDPTVGGTRQGTLTLNDNASGSRQTVALSGTGEDFSLGPISSTSSTVSPGQTASFTVAVSPTGGFNQMVAFTCAGAPASSTCAVSPSSVVLNGSAASTVNVTLATTATAASVLPPGPSATSGYRLLFLVADFLGLALMAGLFSWRKDRRPRLAYGVSLVLLFLGAGMMMSACVGTTNSSGATSSGGGSSSGGGNQTPGTSAGTYTLVVTGTFTSGSTTLKQNTNLTVVVQ